MKLDKNSKFGKLHSKQLRLKPRVTLNFEMKTFYRKTDFELIIIIILTTKQNPEKN